MMTDDTIVAISSAAGLADRAIVRLSGADAFGIASRIFTPLEGKLQDFGGFRWTAGSICLPSDEIQTPALAYIFRAPRSYTRQDLIELHIPGCDLLASKACDELISLGAREASAGEFTARAFFSGRIDLSQAQAVADIIYASDEASRRSAVASLDGLVHRLCKDNSDRIADVLATIEASIDMADEDVQFDTSREISDKLRSIAGDLTKAATDAINIPDQASSLRIVLAGRANVGKSSLLNVLSGTDRAIVSTQAGTTRDVLSETLSLDGYSCDVTIQDAAGLQAIDGAISHRADQAARSAISGADIVLFVFDLSDGFTSADDQLLADVKKMNPSGVISLVGNKCDLLYEIDIDTVIGQISQRANLPINATSTVSKYGLVGLKRCLAEMLNYPSITADTTLGLHLRQKRLLLSARDAIATAADIYVAVASNTLAQETAAIELRWALNQIGQISGQVMTEDILGKIFERFCVGK